MTAVAFTSKAVAAAVDTETMINGFRHQWHKQGVISGSR